MRRSEKTCCSTVSRLGILRLMRIKPSQQTQDYTIAICRERSPWLPPRPSRAPDITIVANFVAEVWAIMWLLYRGKGTKVDIVILLDQATYTSKLHFFTS